MSDVLNQIKAKRNRATVPARVDSLLKQNLSEAEGSDSVALSTERAFADHSCVDEATASSTQQQPRTNSSSGQIEALRAELEKYPDIIRHSAIRLEKELDSKLTRFCKENRCTIETFLEAAFEEAQADAILCEKILSNAHNRYLSRKKAGKLRQLITQLEKAGI